MSKPAAGTALNASSQFYTNLTNAWGILETSGTTLTDSMSGNTLTLGSGWSITPGLGGDSCVASPAGMSLSMLSSPISLTARASWSIAWKMRQNNSHSTIMGNSVLPNDSYIDVWETPSFIQFINTDGTAISTLGSMADPFGTLDYVITSSGTSVKFYQSSVLVENDDVSSHGSRLTINCFGGGGFTSTWFNGVLYYLFVWRGRVLTSSEVASFAINPWQLFGAPAPPPTSGGVMLAHI